MPFRLKLTRARRHDGTLICPSLARRGLAFAGRKGCRMTLRRVVSFRDEPRFLRELGGLIGEQNVELRAWIAVHEDQQNLSLLDVLALLHHQAGHHAHRDAAPD